MESNCWGLLSQWYAPQPRPVRLLRLQRQHRNRAPLPALLEIHTPRAGITSLGLPFGRGQSGPGRSRAPPSGVQQSRSVGQAVPTDLAFFAPLATALGTPCTVLVMQDVSKCTMGRSFLQGDASVTMASSNVYCAPFFGMLWNNMAVTTGCNPIDSQLC